MKVLLIHLPYYHRQPWSMPLGLAYIASVLLKLGIEVKVLDINLLTTKGRYSPKMLDDKLKEDKYLFIGFGAVFFEFTYFRKLSAQIRQTAPDTCQVIGGQYASRIAEALVENTTVDAVVMGEGEEIVPLIVDSLCTGKPLKDLQYVHTRGKPYVQEFAIVKDIDSCPFPARHLFDMEYHKLERWAPDPLFGFSTILATRGCVRKCVFCQPLGGRKLRTRSPENIINEMKYLNENYGVKYFRFNDEAFLGQNEKVLAFCDALENSGLKVVFSIWTWAEPLNERTISRLKEVGCNRIQVGIESGSPQILKEMNKVQNLEKVKRNVQLISDQNLICGSGFLTGTPGATKETLYETRDYIKQLYSIRNFSIARINQIKLMVGSELYRIAKEKGLISDDLEFVLNADEEQMFPCINFTNFDQKEYTRILNDINKELKWDYYSKYKIRIIERLIFADAIDYRNLIRLLSIRDIPTILKKFASVVIRDMQQWATKIKLRK
ncbi:MAG: radical SAM protein [Victivallaceae bacterium]|nr:radical SAM protein [Victivallaceae bacterium]